MDGSTALALQGFIAVALAIPVAVLAVLQLRDRLDAPRPGPREVRRLTAQGHPRSVFQRAIARGNLLVAETILRTEIPRPTLADLLEITALIAQKDRRRHQRAAARWLARYLDTVDRATLDEAALAAASLQALGGRHHDAALSTLRDMAEEASSRRVARGVA